MDDEMQCILRSDGVGPVEGNVDESKRFCSKRKRYVQADEPRTVASVREETTHTRESNGYTTLYVLCARLMCLHHVT